MSVPESHTVSPRKKCFIAAFIAFLAVGGNLPAFLPGSDGGSSPVQNLSPPQLILHGLCSVLYLPQRFLPVGIHDGVRITVGILSVSLWGAAFARLACLVLCRKES